MDTVTLIVVGIAVLLLVLVATVFLLLVYSGLLHEIVFSTGPSPLPSMNIAYLYDVGPYKNCGHLFCKAGKFAPDCDRIGIYYDDPKEVGEQNCRFAVGAVLGRGDEPVDEALKKSLEEEGYSFFTLPYCDKTINSTFPFTTTLSIYIYIQRFYPAMEKYIEGHKFREVGACIEVYEDQMIKFFAPLENSGGFMIPEALQDGEEDEQ